jgi:transcriptional regulator with XRE-family HTH domain
MIYNISRQQLGNNITRARLKRKLNQTQLATLCGWHQERQCKMEAGKYNLTLQTLNILADALRVPIKDFFQPTRKNSGKGNGKTS